MYYYTAYLTVIVTDYCQGPDVLDTHVLICFDPYAIKPHLQGG